MSIVLSSDKENLEGVNSVGELIVDEPEELLIRSNGSNVSPSSAPLLLDVGSVYEEPETTDKPGTLWQHRYNYESYKINDCFLIKRDWQFNIDQLTTFMKKKMRI